MAQMQEMETTLRQERFRRLVDARNACVRWELRRSRILFEIRLESMGAWVDDDGIWRLGAPPAAGSRVPN